MKIVDKFFFSTHPFNYMYHSYTLSEGGIKLNSVTIKCINEERIRYQHAQLDDEVLSDVEGILKNNEDNIFVVRKEKTIEINYIISTFSIDRIVDINELDYDMYYIFLDNVYYIKKISSLLVEICFKNNEKIVMNVDFDKILVLYERLLLNTDNNKGVLSSKKGFL